MGYGFEVHNSDDSSLVLSASSENSFFVGLGVLYTYEAPHSDGGANIYTWRFFYDLPAYNSSVYPTVFIMPGTCTGYYDTEVIKWDSARNNWVAIIATNASCYPDLYTFLPSSEMSTVTGDYGLQLKNDSGDVTFDSRWGKRLLTVDLVVSATASPGNYYNFSSIASPAFMYSSKYVRGAHNTVRQFVYGQGIKLTNTQLVFGEVNIYDWLTTVNIKIGTWGDDDQQVIPIIDCSKF